MIYEHVLKRKEESSYSPGEILRKLTLEKALLPRSLPPLLWEGKSLLSGIQPPLPCVDRSGWVPRPRKYNQWEMENFTETIFLPGQKESSNRGHYYWFEVPK